ncbi:host attachment protein [Candidatus Gracilibacteria bacterium]|nr:host attachment protein [Candidatus Gracilibacteria bacterium]MCF7819251.1 host attachment protein [Candidatus Gracilibacteria bacterium]
MQIPQTQVGFDIPTYFVVLDGTTAKFFLAHRHIFEQQDEFQTDDFQLDDTEKNMTVDTSTGIHDGLEDENIKNRVRQKFFSKIAHILFKRKQEGKYKKLIVVLPQEHKKEFLEKLHPEVSSILSQVIPKIMTKTKSDELLTQLQKTRKDA